MFSINYINYDSYTDTVWPQDMRLADDFKLTSAHQLEIFCKNAKLYLSHKEINAQIVIIKEHTCQVVLAVALPNTTDSLKKLSNLYITYMDIPLDLALLNRTTLLHHNGQIPAYILAAHSAEPFSIKQNHDRLTGRAISRPYIEIR